MPKPRKTTSKAKLEERIAGLFSAPAAEVANAGANQGSLPPGVTAPTPLLASSGRGIGETVFFVTFRLGDQHWAVPLDRVQRILRMVAVIPVPEEPAWVAGAINMHGRVVPALHLGRRLGGTVHEPGLNDRLIVVRAREDVAALIVDEVTDVAGIPAEQVALPPEPLSESPFLSAVIRQGESLVMVIDVTRLMLTGTPSTSGELGGEA